MQGGHVHQVGTPWEVYYRPRTAFMAEFLGSVNLIPAAVTHVNGATVGVVLEGRQFDVCADAPPRAAEVLLSIRPETLSLRPEPEDGAVALAGEVVGRAFLGHLMRYTVRIGQQDWLVDEPDPGRAGLAEGAVVVQVNPRRVHVIPEPNA